jgi:fused signal recognition particle receptor
LEWPELYQQKRLGYPVLGGTTMTDQEEQSLKEAKRAERRTTEEIEQSARDRARREANLAREQVIEEDQKKREAKRAEKRTAEEIEQSARDQARREANLAREQAIEEDQEARKLKAKKQSRE